MTKNNLSLAQKLKVHGILLEALVKSGSGWAYIEPFNDEYIANKVEFECTLHNVAGIRKELFGQLVKPADASLEGRLSEVERLIEELKDSPTEHVKDGLRDRILNYEKTITGLRSHVISLTAFVKDICNELGIKYNAEDLTITK